MPNYPRYPVPGPLKIPNCSEVKIVWQQGGMFISNVLHGALTAAGPLSPTVAESIFSDLKANAATATWLGKLDPGIQLFAVHVKDLRDYYLPTVESSSAALVGTSTGAIMPQGVALVVTLRTAFSGKGFFGRSYLPGITGDNMADTRHWAGTIDTPAIAFMNAINTAMTGQGMPWVLAQRQLAASTDPNAPPPYNQVRQATTIPIQQAAISDHRIDSQRRRLGR